MATKRKNESSNTAEGRGKKLRLSDEESAPHAGSSTKPISPTQEAEDAPFPVPSSQNNLRGVDTPGGKLENHPQKQRIRKLTPKRPWPIVPTSASATGPPSAHKEGKNLVCISRKTGLGAYMRRCRDVIIKDGYKTLHLSAMGAAIPLLLQLTCALPPILPFTKDDIKTEITTGTCGVEDEVFPDDEDEDATLRERSKSTLLVVITIGDGKFEGDTPGPLKRKGENPSRMARGASNAKGKGKPIQAAVEAVYAEPDQEDLMDML